MYACLGFEVDFGLGVYEEPLGEGGHTERLRLIYSKSGPVA